MLIHFSMLVDRGFLQFDMNILITPNVILLSCHFNIDIQYLIFAKILVLVGLLLIEFSTKFRPLALIWRVLE